MYLKPNTLQAGVCLALISKLGCSILLHKAAVMSAKHKALFRWACFAGDSTAKAGKRASDSSLKRVSWAPLPSAGDADASEESEVSNPDFYRGKTCAGAISCGCLMLLVPHMSEHWSQKLPKWHRHLCTLLLHGL